MKAGTAVKVGIGVNVEMAVAAGVGVHVGGRVKGMEVCGGREVAIGLPQVERNRIHKNKAREVLFCKR